MIRAATPSEIMAVVGELPLPYSSNMRGVTNGEATVIYDGWTPSAVQMHLHSRGPKSIFDRSFLNEVFGYPFVQCGRKLIYTVTPGNSEASLAISRALGFREVYRIRDGWSDGVDMVLKEMRKEDCRYGLLQ